MLLPVVIGLPVAAGLAATVLQAFGLTPGLGGSHLSLDAWTRLADAPGLYTSVALTLRTGLLATSLAAASALAIGLLGRPLLWRGAAPLLAVPHAAMAIGIGFLVSPTGWLVRLAGLPPLGAGLLGDRVGGPIILALWVKETPFLLLCLLAALGQAEVARSRLAASCLGYAPLRVALFVVLPRVWPQLRLPVLAVLAFSLSVTDVALVLGPQTPPTLAVQVLRWSTDPDLSRWPLAASGALLLLGLVLAGFASLLGVEAALAAIGRQVIGRGRRGTVAAGGVATSVAGLVGLCGLAGLATLLLWSGAFSWRFPAALPTGWSVRLLAGRLGGLDRPAATTLWLGLASTGISILLAVAVLQGRAMSRLVWLPLLLPQAAFLFGALVLLVAADLDGSVLVLVWSHVLFVLPYVVLALAGPFRALDRRYGRAAASLGASPWRVLCRITLPLLAGPLGAAAAIGFGVSAAQYLPTLFAGAGRIETLATRAVSLASGADRRLLAATALAQAVLPMAGFAAAFALRPRR